VVPRVGTEVLRRRPSGGFASRRRFAAQLYPLPLYLPLCTIPFHPFLVAPGRMDTLVGWIGGHSTTGDLTRLTEQASGR